MNIFKFEIKKLCLSSAIWTLAISLVLWGFMVGVYPLFQESAADINKVMAGFPPSFAAAFGVDITNLLSFGGYYNFCFGYISVIGAIMASFIGISIFSRESRAKCSDFLLTKPVSRKKVFIYKYLTGISLIAACNVVYLVVIIIIGKRNDTSMILPGLSLILTQLVFFALGIFYAVSAKKVHSVSGSATIFGFSSFILSAMVNILNSENLRYIAPLKYFEPLKVFYDGGYEVKYAVAGTVVFLVCTLLAYLRMTKSDIRGI